jgi:hypothetical protein
MSNASLTGTPYELIHLSMKHNVLGSVDAATYLTILLSVFMFQLHRIEVVGRSHGSEHLYRDCRKCLHQI